jgi:hypothetical protein
MSLLLCIYLCAPLLWPWPWASSAPAAALGALAVGERSSLSVALVAPATGKLSRRRRLWPRPRPSSVLVVTIVADAGGPDGGAGSPDVGSRGARADRKKNGAKGGRSSLRITGGLHVTAVYWSKDAPSSQPNTEVKPFYRKTRVDPFHPSRPTTKHILSLDLSHSILRIK